MNDTDAIVKMNNMKDIKNITSNTKYINLNIDKYDKDIINYFIDNGNNYAYADSLTGRNGFIYTSYDVFRNSEIIISNILDNMPSDLSALEIVRYIYTKLGKILSVDINTIDSKNEKIPFYMINTINNIWSSISLGRTNDEVTAKIMVYLCSRMNIKCELINNSISEHIANKVYIDNSYIIIDLYSDLYNIQSGFTTKYFDKYNSDKEMDKKIKYIKKDYNDNLIEDELRGFDYTKEDMLKIIFNAIEKYINVNAVGVVELAKICKDIFERYCPNYDIKINNLYLMGGINNKEHFIIISYNYKCYSYNYSTKKFISVDYDTIYKNIKSRKIGIYEDEDLNFIESRMTI